MFGAKWGFRKKRSNRSNNDKSASDVSANVSISSMSTKSMLSTKGGPHPGGNGDSNRSIAAASLASHVDKSSDDSGSDDESMPVYLTMEETLNLGVLDHIDRQIAILDPTDIEQSAEVDSFLLFEDAGFDDGTELEMARHRGSRFITKGKTSNNDSSNSSSGGESEKENNGTFSPKRKPPLVDSGIARESVDGAAFSTSSRKQEEKRHVVTSAIYHDDDSAESKQSKQSSLSEEYSLEEDGAYNEKAERERDELDAVLDEVLADSPVNTPPETPPRTPPSGSKQVGVDAATDARNDTQHVWMCCLEENGVDLSASPLFNKDDATSLSSSSPPKALDTDNLSPTASFVLPVLNDTSQAGQEQQIPATPESCTSAASSHMHTITLPGILKTFDFDKDAAKILYPKNTEDTLDSSGSGVGLETKLSYSPSCASSELSMFETAPHPQLRRRSEEFFTLSYTNTVVSSLGVENDDMLSSPDHPFLLDSSHVGKLQQEEEEDDEKLQDPLFLLQAADRNDSGDAGKVEEDGALNQDLHGDAGNNGNKVVEESLLLLPISQNENNGGIPRNEDITLTPAEEEQQEEEIGETTGSHKEGTPNQEQNQLALDPSSNDSTPPSREQSSEQQRDDERREEHSENSGGERSPGGAENGRNNEDDERDTSNESFNSKSKEDEEEDESSNDAEDEEEDLDSHQSTNSEKIEVRPNAERNPSISTSAVSPRISEIIAKTCGASDKEHRPGLDRGPANVSETIVKTLTAARSLKSEKSQDGSLALSNSNSSETNHLELSRSSPNVFCVGTSGSTDTESPRKIAMSIFEAKEALHFDVVRSFDAAEHAAAQYSPRNIYRSKSEPDDAFSVYSSKYKKSAREKRQLLGIRPATQGYFLSKPKSSDQSTPSPRTGDAHSSSAEESESPRKIAQSFFETKNALRLDVVKSINPSESKSQSSFDTESPRKIAASIFEAKEELHFCVVRSFDGADQCNTASKPENSKSLKNQGTHKELLNPIDVHDSDTETAGTIRRPGADSPGNPPPMSPQPRFHTPASGSPVCVTIQVPPHDKTNAVEHTQISFLPHYSGDDEEKKECDLQYLPFVGTSGAPFPTIWETTGAEGSGRSKSSWIGNMFVFYEDMKPKTQQEIDNDPYKWAYVVWIRKGLLDTRKWECLLSEAQGTGIDAKSHGNDEEEEDENEMQDELSSPLIVQRSSAGVYDFREVDESDETKVQQPPSQQKSKDRRSFPAAPRTRNEPKTGIRRRKSFANIMKMWRDKSDDKPLSIFLSPEQSVRSTRTCRSRGRAALSPGRESTSLRPSVAPFSETSAVIERPSRKDYASLQPSATATTADDTDIAVERARTKGPTSSQLLADTTGNGFVSEKSSGKESTSLQPSVETTAGDTVGINGAKSPAIQEFEGKVDEPSLSASKDRVSAARDLVQTPEGESTETQKHTEKNESWRIDVNQLNSGKPNLEMRTLAFAKAASPQKIVSDRNPGKLKMQITPVFSRISPADPRSDGSASSKFDKRHISSIFRNMDQLDQVERLNDWEMRSEPKKDKPKRIPLHNKAPKPLPPLDCSNLHTVEEKTVGGGILRAPLPPDEMPEQDREKSPSFSVDLMWQHSSQTDDQSGARDAGFLVLPKPSFAQASTFHFRHQSSDFGRGKHSTHRSSMSRGRTVDEQLQRPSRRQSVEESRRKRNAADLEEKRERRISEPLRFNLSPSSRSKADYKSVLKSFLASTEEHQAAGRGDIRSAPTENTNDTNSPSLYFKQAPSYEKKPVVAETPSAVALLAGRQDIPSEIAVKEDTPMTAASSLGWLKVYQADTESRGTTAATTPRTGGSSQHRQLDLVGGCSFDAADSVLSDDDEQPCECVASIFSGNDELANFFLPKMGMACTCGKRRLGLANPDEPTSLKNILRPWQVRFLAGFGITRGDQLVKANHRSAQALATSLRQYRKKHRMTSFRTKSCGMAIQIWSRTAKTFVRSIRKQLVEGTDRLEPPNTMEILSSFLDKMHEMNHPRTRTKSPKEGPKEEI
ncbi:hypothetical protein ACA910_012192 [Epithemia clementina (nom. ined.)]